MDKTRKRGRPVEKEMPVPIPDTPENVARALLTTPPKKKGEWNYLKGESPQLREPHKAGNTSPK